MAEAIVAHRVRLAAATSAQAQRNARSRTKCVNPRGNCRSPPAVPADIPLLVLRTVDKPSVAQRVFHNIHRAPVAVDKSCRRPAGAATVPETTARPRARSSPSPPPGNRGGLRLVPNRACAVNTRTSSQPAARRSGICTTLSSCSAGSPPATVLKSHAAHRSRAARFSAA